MNKLFQNFENSLLNFLIETKFLVIDLNKIKCFNYLIGLGKSELPSISTA